jgi:hypothetical protein
VVLNRVAKSVIDGQRELHPDYVFPHRGNRIFQMNNSGWQTAWKKAGLPIDGEYTKGSHNLKHTFGRRLRAVGVSFEARKVLLHHKSGDITTHYSPAELEELINEVEKNSVKRVRQKSGIHFDKSEFRKRTTVKSLNINTLWCVDRDSNPGPSH